MTTMVTKAMFLCLVLTTTAFGQTFELTVQNQQVSGSDFVFDIYILRTGGTNIYLGNSDFVLTFNAENFTSPSYEIVTIGTTRLDTYYSLATSILSGNRAILNVGAPTPTTQAQFDSRVEVISNSGNGTLIATVKLTNISNPSATAGLQWRLILPNKTIVNNFQNTSPWTQSDISANGTYTNPVDTSLPVELFSFTASAGTSVITIRWTTQSEINNLGFNVYRSETAEGPYQKINTDIIKGSGNSTEQHSYVFVDDRLVGSEKYYYKLEDIDLSGKSRFHGPIEANFEPVTLPEHFGLSQNFPNPFNPMTSITLQLPRQEKVELLIFNRVGQVIRRLVDKEMQAGSPQIVWDARNDSGEQVASGIYLCQMVAGEYKGAIKMLLLK